MRFSLLNSNQNYMYRYNPYLNSKPAIPLTMEAFAAPANFDPDAQELNIVKAFAAYSDVNKKYIFSVGTSTTTVLPAVASRTYAYAENGGAYTAITSGTVTWTVGSTKRNVIVIDYASSIVANIPLGGVWCYLGDKINEFFSANNTYLKYVHCQKLTSIQYISYADFFSCSGLTSITIPSSVTSIGLSAFESCSGLTSITIPSSVTSIGNAAFRSCSGLTSITIPSSVTSIGNAAFWNCTNAIFNNDNLVLNSLSVNLAQTFVNCYRLKSVDLTGCTITSLGTYAFFSCSGLTSITIPSSVTSIGLSAFESCSGLTSITIPSSVTSIGNAAFRSCSGATSITIPSSVTSIGDAAFWNCTNAIFNNDNLVLNSLSVNLAQTFVNCYRLKSVDLTGCTITSIGSNSFYSCSGLTSITIPSSVTSIGDAAFWNCSGITSMKCYAIVPPTLSGLNLFLSIPKTSLHVPTGRKSAYDAVDQWTDFEPIIEDL